MTQPEKRSIENLFLLMCQRLVPEATRILTSREIKEGAPWIDKRVVIDLVLDKDFQGGSITLRFGGGIYSLRCTEDGKGAVPLFLPLGLNDQVIVWSEIPEVWPANRAPSLRQILMVMLGEEEVPKESYSPKIWFYLKNVGLAYQFSIIDAEKGLFLATPSIQETFCEKPSTLKEICQGWKDRDV